MDNIPIASDLVLLGGVVLSAAWFIFQIKMTVTKLTEQISSLGRSVDSLAKDVKGDREELGQIKEDVAVLKSRAIKEGN